MGSTDGTLPSARPAPGLVYVAGYGRSGSTLLDTLLDGHSSVFGGGELTWLFRDAADGRECSCGLAVAQCGFWSEVLREVASRLGHDDWSSSAGLSLATETIGRWRSPSPEYARQWSAVLDAIGQVSGAKWIVDSSKNSRLAHHRLPLLGRHPGRPVRVLHLVRDPRAVMWSAARGSNRRIEAGMARPKNPGGMWRGLLGWTFSNLAVEHALRRNPGWPALRLRYEDVVAQPARALKQLGGFLKLDMTEVIRRVEQEQTFAAGHGIRGNRMRRSGRIVLRFDREWETRLPASARAGSMISWPLLRKYRYVE